MATFLCNDLYYLNVKKLNTSKGIRSLSLFWLTFSLVGLFSCHKNDVTMFLYSDQNNNLYSITTENLTYTAVKPLQSSSGTYSGGENRTITISDKDFRSVKKLVSQLEKDTTVHSDRREMLTSVLKFVRNGEHVQLILVPSEKREQLEIKLKELLQMDLP